MPDYRKLRVFELAQTLNEQVHALAPNIVPWRTPGLRGQLCRAISSVPANIAEGAAQGSAKQYMRYLRIAMGSAQKASVHLHLAASIQGRNAHLFHQNEQRARMVAALLAKLIARIEEDEARRRVDKTKKSTTLTRPTRPTRLKGEQG